MKLEKYSKVDLHKLYNKAHGQSVVSSEMHDKCSEALKAYGTIPLTPMLLRSAKLREIELSEYKHKALQKVNYGFTSIWLGLWCGLATATIYALSTPVIVAGALVTAVSKLPEAHYSRKFDKVQAEVDRRYENETKERIARERQEKMELAQAKAKEEETIKVNQTKVKETTKLNDRYDIVHEKTITTVTAPAKSAPVQNTQKVNTQVQQAPVAEDDGMEM